MECVCVKPCYLSHEGIIAQYRKGDLVEFEKCPEHFVAIGELSIDFEKATEDVLLAADIDEDELRAYAKKEFGLTLRKGLRKETLVSKFVSVRDRFMEPPDVEDSGNAE